MSIAFSDKVLTCRDCGEQFTWTAGEQEFYQTKGLTNPPARCPSCRAARKASQGGANTGTAYSLVEATDSPRPYRSNGGGGRPPFGGGGNSAGGFANRAPRQLFDAVCAECGQPTQIPFQPRGDRPVYCRDCFERRKAAGM